MERMHLPVDLIALIWGFKSLKLNFSLLLYTLFALHVFTPFSGFCQQQNQLVILSPHWEGIREEFEAAFKQQIKESQGKDISFKWLDVGGTSEIVRFIKSEFAHNKDGIGVDLVFGGGIDPYFELKHLGFLAPTKLSSDLINTISPSVAGLNIYDPDFTWYAPVLGAFGIFCNEEVLSRLHIPPPKTWEDLTNLAFHSWLSSADPRRSGANHMMYEIVLQGYGWDKGWKLLYGLAQNTRSFTSQSTQPLKDVESGEVACAFALDSQAWASIRESQSSQLRFILPEGITIISGDGIAVLRGAPNLSLAQEFINFLLSEKAQKMWMLKKGSPGGPIRYDIARMPVLPTLYNKKALAQSYVNINPFKWHPAFQYDSSKASLRWGILNDLIGAFLIESHDSLADADSADFSAPISEGEIQTLVGQGNWNDPLIRSQRLNEWNDKVFRHSSHSDKDASFWKYFPLLLILLFGLYFLLRRQFR